MDDSRSWLEIEIVRLQEELKLTEAMGANKFDGFSTEDMEAEITRRKKANEIERVYDLSNSVTPLNEHNHEDYKLVQPLLSWYEGRQQNPVTVTVKTGALERWTYRRQGNGSTSVPDLIEEELVAEVGRLRTLVASAEERLSDYRKSRLPYKVDEVIEANTSWYWEKAIVRRVTSTGMYYVSPMRKNGQWSLRTQFVLAGHMRKAASGG